MTTDYFYVNVNKMMIVKKWIKNKAKKQKPKSNYKIKRKKKTQIFYKKKKGNKMATSRSK